MFFINNLSIKSKRYILIGVVAHFFAAYFSAGFFNIDEQTQVLNLVGFKLGHYDVSYLSDQYAQAIRPWFHPAIYLWCSKVLILFSPFNPFVHAFFYRLLSSALGLISLGALYKTFERELSEINGTEAYFFFASFLWYFPFLHARPGNENICAIFFVFALYFLKKGENYKNFIFAGALFALSFIVRFQIAVMIATVCLWYLFNYKEFRKIFLLTLIFMLTLGFSTVFDTYMYGHFTFAPYNYYFMNIVQKYASSFGVTPFYQYFIYAVRDNPAPVGLLVIFSFLFFWIRFPKHILTWITLPFFIVHSLIGHKEFRFLFPIAPFLPLILVYVFHSLKWENKNTPRRVFLICNIPLLMFSSITPATSTSRFFKYLYENEIPVEKVFVFSEFEDNSKFYLKNDIKYIVLKNDEVMSQIHADKRTYFLTKNLIERDFVLNDKSCRTSFTLYPEWIYDLEFIKKRRTFRSWSFVECIN
jgi:phosphatidylinositol glycan class B